MSSSANATVRCLVPLDIGAVMELSSLAGWNQTAEDWKMLLNLEPQGCFGIEADGHIVATTTVLSFGQKVAWVGMVLTHPDFRKRGFAHELIARAMERARRLGIQTVKLDATQEGRPLYESFGFREEQPVERWLRQAAAQEPSGFVDDSPAPEPSAMDIEACGYDRSALIAALKERSRSLQMSGGYLLSRPGRLCRYIGPCVARDAVSASTLLRRCMESIPEANWFWDLLPQNKSAREIAERLGFAPQRRLTRMSFGPRLLGREEWIYAIAGFELG